MEQTILAGLIGSWKLVSVHYTMSDNGEVIDEPVEGVCNFDVRGRWTVVVVPRGVGPPVNEAQRAAIFDRTVAFSGLCHFVNDRLEVRPDAASNPTFKDMTFIRFFNLDGDRLTISQPEWEHPFFPGRKTVGTVLWDRDR